MPAARGEESACRPDAAAERIAGAVVQPPGQTIVGPIAGSIAGRSGLAGKRGGNNTRISEMISAGFPREARLLSRSQFKRVFGARQVESNRYFRIHWAGPEEDSGSTGPRMGLAIAKRVARRAVDRNRIRRAARETFRLRRCKLQPVDYVVLARPPAADADSQTLKLALEQLWLRFESK